MYNIETAVPFRMLEGYRVGFYSSDEHEQPHVHVLRGGSEAKVWIDPVSLQHNHGYNERELNRVLELVQRYQADLREMWREHFGQPQH